jgi:hypothetical protein
MGSISGSSEQRYIACLEMYYEPSQEIGRSQCSYFPLRKGGGERKESSEGLLAREERRLPHNQAWAMKKGWHKGIRRNARGKTGASDSAAFAELVDSQLLDAGKGRHLKRAEIVKGGNQLFKRTAHFCCERAAEGAVAGRTDLMAQDKQVVNNRGDRLCYGGLERERVDRPRCSQPVKHERGWHDDKKLDRL